MGRCKLTCGENRWLSSDNPGKMHLFSPALSRMTHKNSTSLRSCPARACKVFSFHHHLLCWGRLLTSFCRFLRARGRTLAIPVVDSWGVPLCDYNPAILTLTMIFVKQVSCVPIVDGPIAFSFGVTEKSCPHEAWANNILMKKSRIVPGSSDDFWSPFFLRVFYACRCFHIVNLDLVCLIQHMVYPVLSKLSFQNIIHVR